MPLPVRTLALAAALVAHVPPLVAGVLTPGYSPIRQYISELGAIDAPHGALVSFGTFLPAGVLLVLTCLALGTRVPPTPRARLGLALLALLGVSWVVAAFAPCDAGCPAEGSARQALHNLGGIVGYLGAGAGLLLLAGAWRTAGAPAMHVRLTTACGLLLIVGLFVMPAPEVAAVRGAVQRVMELAASGWMIAAAWRSASTMAS